MTLADSSTLSGGGITVDGMAIVIPENLLVTLPSINVAWPELFDSSGAALLPGLQSWQATVSKRTRPMFQILRKGQ